MTDRPILFFGPMVRAILREIEQPGTGKTQSRRVLDAWCDEPPAVVEDGVITAFDENDKPYRWPRKAAVGDRLYVREAWKTHAEYDDLSPAAMGGDEPIEYQADGAHQSWGYPGISKIGRFRHGMHMPRWASRITLIVNDVRVQRLQEISEADAIAEGIRRSPHGNGDQWLHYPAGSSAAGWVDPRESYRTLWDSLNAKRGYGWDRNPWVAAYTFETHPCNIDEVELANRDPEVTP